MSTSEVKEGISFGGKPRFFNNKKEGGNQTAPPNKNAQPFYPSQAGKNNDAGCKYTIFDLFHIYLKHAIKYTYLSIF